MSRRVPDISKIQRMVGYRPKVHLDEILERVIAYWEPPSPVAVEHHAELLRAA
jgi:nucleoside-diphosphate-sugar epimerase